MNIENKANEYFLNPGELIFSKKPIVVKTVLGSCVAVCIYDKVNRWGGICHYLLPVAPSDEQRSTKFGDVAIKTLLHRFLKNTARNGKISLPRLSEVRLSSSMNGKYFLLETGTVKLQFPFCGKKRFKSGACTPEESMAVKCFSIREQINSW
jgi:chemotaxis protein CheD